MSMSRIMLSVMESVKNAISGLGQGLVFDFFNGFAKGAFNIDVLDVSRPEAAAHVGKLTNSLAQVNSKLSAIRDNEHPEHTTESIERDMVYGSMVIANNAIIKNEDKLVDAFVNDTLPITVSEIMDQAAKEQFIENVAGPNGEYEMAQIFFSTESRFDNPEYKEKMRKFITEMYKDSGFKMTEALGSMAVDTLLNSLSDATKLVKLQVKNEKDPSSLSPTERKELSDSMEDISRIYGGSTVNKIKEVASKVSEGQKYNESGIMPEIN